MATVSNLDIIRVTAKMVHNNEPISNVFHARYAGASGQPDTTIHAAIATVLDTAYAFILSDYTNGLVFSTIETWNLTQDAPMDEQAWPVITAGTSTGDISPRQTAPLVLFNTAVARSQGRKFLPAPLEGSLDTYGEIGSPMFLRLANFGVSLVGPFTAGAGTCAMGNYAPLLLRFAQWVSYSVVLTAKTQRRRYLG